MASPPANSSKAEEKKLEIILAAATVFAEKGYAETTLSDVSSALGIHTAGLYYYFENKDALVEALLKYAAQRLTARYQAVLDQLEGKSADERLRAVIKRYVQIDSTRDSVGSAFWKIYDQVSPELQGAVQIEAKTYFKLWRELVRDAFSEGTIDPDIPPGILRQLLIGTLLYIKEWYRPDGNLTTDEISDVVINLFLNKTRRRKTATKSKPATGMSASRARQSKSRQSRSK